MKQNLNINVNCILNSTSFSQLDSSTWNIDMQELEYNPSKKDLTDAKIHHLLAEELCKPYRRVRVIFLHFFNFLYRKFTVHAKIMFIWLEWLIGPTEVSKLMKSNSPTVYVHI